MTFNFPSRLTVAVALAGLAFWANAQDSDDRAQPHRLGGGVLFVSPCGKPYRAAPGEPYPVTVWFAEADTNHDGFLERDEFRADAAAFFAVLDSNHDGVVDTDEVRFYEHTIVPEMLHGGATPEAMGEAKLFLAQFSSGGHGGRGGQSYSGSAPTYPRKVPLSETGGLAPYGLLGEPEPVTAADTEFNGRITAAEFRAAADRRFEALDVNGQGRIALKDLPLTVAQQAAPAPRA